MPGIPKKLQRDIVFPEQSTLFPLLVDDQRTTVYMINT